MQDKNFDPLAKKFAKNIYGTPKGEVRAAVVWRDLNLALTHLGDKPLRILDAGGGFGFFSQKLAKMGHQVTLCDISSEMLAIAKTQIKDYEHQHQEILDINFIHAPIQALNVAEHGQFDLVLCHAVAEWLSDAEQTLGVLTTLVKPNGLFSLMFYNKEAMRFFNLVSGNFDYVAAGLKVKKKVGLTPTHPLYIEQVRGWLDNWNMTTITESGVRVIHDYLKQQQPANTSFNQLIEMELCYSQHPAYLPLGRYVHFICQWR
ncbi:tRNA 5-carboxymethoxyuridine methyltransferase [Shewanella colwelliana]|uniref:methyltransferase domain-containing protein n=1 Tax=Shewanella colwelliana TaxID=23 RepID=UPI001BBE0176|nr:methyltransferase domain-containing protein [Shewanella colwelliana]GIU16241.1 tRNA 5-carboxymethoxyuridine methyltransferase [Shewanella colwelliana]